MIENLKNMILYYLYWYMISMFSAGGFVFFLYQYLKPRFNVFVSLLPFTIYIFVLTQIRDTLPAPLIATILTPLLFVLCTSLVFYGTLKRKLIIVGACYLCVLIVESITGIILLLAQIDYNEFNSHPFFDILYTIIIVNAFLILFSIILRPILKSNYTFGYKVDKFISVMVATAAMAVALLLCFVIKLPQQNLTAFISATLNICMTIGSLLFICYLLKKMATAMEQEKEQALLSQNYELSLIKAEQMTCYQSEIDELHGGMIRILGDLCICLKDNDITSAIAIASKNISVIEQIKRTKNYENNVADYLISKLEKQCDKGQASLDVKCSLPKDIGIDEMDFCVVLSNIIDNALNACNQLTGKGYINLSLHKNHNILYIGCENSSPKEESVKKPKRRLGSFGLRNIKDTAEKYHGDVQIRKDDEIFSIEVLLYCNE